MSFVGVLASERWRNKEIPEYKVELLNLPVSAFRRATDLEPLS